MPPYRPEQPSRLIHTTPFPNALLDEVMPTLRDTEWRLLCLIVRQTLGWQAEEGRRKTRDWMTHSQLRSRSGRASEAVSKALDVLVRRGLVEVQSDAGGALLTPAERRRYGGRMFFRLGARIREESSCASSKTPEKRKGAGMQKKAAPSKARVSSGQETFSESEIRFPKITKETCTKRDGVVDSRKAAVSADEDGIATEAALPAEPVQEPLALEIGEETRQFIAIYHERYRRRFPQRPSPFVSDAEAGELERRLAAHSHAELLTLLEVFFACNLSHIQRRDHRLEAFTSNLHILRVIKPDWHVTPG